MRGSKTNTKFFELKKNSYFSYRLCYTVIRILFSDSK